MLKKELQIILLVFLVHTGIYGQGYALDFDGSNDYVITPIDADLQAMPSTTWSGWIKPGVASDWDFIFGMEDGGWDRFLAIENGGLSMGHTSNRWATGASVTVGVWQHVVVVYDNGAMRFYYNGTEYTTGTAEGGHSSVGTFIIGGRQFGGHYYRGLIDEVAVWNEALTAAEITALYNAGSGLDAASNSGNYASASNLVGYYKMNEGTGTTTTDASGNGNTATLSNMDAATDWVTGVSVVVSQISTNGLVLHLDSRNTDSYPGSGTTWYDLTANNNDVTFQNSGAISFNSTDKYLDTGSNGYFSRASGVNIPTGNSSYTLAVYVNQPQWESNGFISIGGFGTNMSNALRTFIGNKIRHYWWSNDLDVSPSGTMINNWLYIVAKFDGTTRSIWVNGVLVNSDTPGSSHNVNSSALQISKTYNSEYQKGKIMAAMIYNRAISDLEIVQNNSAVQSAYDSPSTVTLTDTDSDNIVTDSNTVTITATFSESMTSAPTISIDLASGTDISAATMVQGSDATTWSYDWDVPSGSDGIATVTVAGADLAGNAYAGSTNLVLTIDNSAPTINAIATSDFSWGASLNATEDNSDGTVTVTTSGAEDGRVVTIILNSATYTGTVNTNSATVTITASDLQALSVGSSYTLTADVSDAAGNAATQITSASFTVDASLPTITNFNNYTKTYFDGSFTIIDPTSTSAGAFTYTSDNVAVATISGNTVTIIGAGTANITATQAADATYSGGSSTVSLTVNSVSVVDKYGRISTTSVHYVNKYGGVGGTDAIGLNGEKVLAKTTGNGLTSQQASTSAYAIKQAYPSSTDGVYWIANSNINGGAPFQIYADMTTDGGGWTLIMCNQGSAGWTFANTISRNVSSPSVTANYSIIGWADHIKKSTTGFQYMLDAHARRSNGGIWTVNNDISFASTSNASTIASGAITRDLKYGTWPEEDNGDNLGPRMPYYTSTNEAFLTTDGNDGGHWWGALVTFRAGYVTAPWMNTGGVQSPNYIWYWVR